MIIFFEKRKVLSWLVVFIGIALIFYISGLSFGPGESVVGGFTIFYHFFAFFWLAFFISISMIHGKSTSLKLTALVVSLALLYAASDEIHQMFVPGRSCNFFDFFTDSAGILFANLIYIFRLRNKFSIPS